MFSGKVTFSFQFYNKNTSSTIVYDQGAKCLRKFILVWLGASLVLIELLFNWNTSACMYMIRLEQHRNYLLQKSKAPWTVQIVLKSCWGRYFHYLEGIKNIHTNTTRKCQRRNWVIAERARDRDGIVVSVVNQRWIMLVKCICFGVDAGKL